jgi:hypothetical protein
MKAFRRCVLMELAHPFSLHRKKDANETPYIRTIQIYQPRRRARGGAGREISIH